MTTKEKANDLIIKYQINSTLLYSQAKQCASIAVDEMIEESIGYLSIERNKYWKKVKQEINKL
jgi:hypothetical protein